MSVVDDRFQQFLHPLVHVSMEKSDSFWDRYGKFEHWYWDADAVTLTFSDPMRPSLVVDVTVVGTTKGDRWQWTWANKNFDARSKIGMETVKEFGESHGFIELTSPFLDADEHTGWEMTSVSVHLLGAIGSYRFPTDEGYCYLAFRKVHEVLQ